MTAFDSFGTIKPSFSITLSILVGLIFPDLSMKIPNDRRKSFRSIATSTREIAIGLLDKATKEKADDIAGEVDKSILGSLGENLPFLANNGLLRLTE